VADDQARETVVVVTAFNDAFNSHDVDAVMALMTDDAVFEGTTPPDGERYEGAPAVRAFWETFFTASPTSHFEAEDLTAAADRCVVRWIHRWQDDSGAHHVRGVDLIRVSDGKVAEKLAYVKG
jgi:ketosteroid isomerase-like protein